MDIILYYLISSLAIVIIMTVMGFTKAYTSYKLGDVAIKNMGKVSLNPKKHFEILGFIIFLFFNFGWTAPVDTSSLYYKNRKRDTILVCVVPLIVAIILAFLSNIIYSILFNVVGTGSSIDFITLFFKILTKLYVNFAVFNIIPIYPLFGQKLFQTILPINKSIKLSQYEKIFQVLIIFLLLSGLLQYVLNFISSIILLILNMPIKAILGAI